MKGKTQLYRVISLAGALLWCMTGIIIIGSMLNEISQAFINSMMGMIFLAIGYYLYLKSRNSLQLLTGYLKTENRTVLNKFFLLECIFASVIFFTGLLLFSATVSRAFFEKMPIFG
ncbi:hypothetical protein AAG747_27260 [Rapidithrix thailandica]|uniref:Transporter n=1 Tax=Rapidithrix thailandica TaxID=413964 RepID=A0AAW9SH43_9BACT